MRRPSQGSQGKASTSGDVNRDRSLTTTPLGLSVSPPSRANPNEPEPSSSTGVRMRCSSSRAQSSGGGVIVIDSDEEERNSKNFFQGIYQRALEQLPIDTPNGIEHISKILNNEHFIRSLMQGANRFVEFTFIVSSQ